MLCRLDHQRNSFQGVRPSMELCPVDPVLVTAAVVSTSIPHTVQIGVCTHVVPPASLLVMSTVPWNITEERLIRRDSLYKYKQRAYNAGCR